MRDHFLAVKLQPDAARANRANERRAIGGVRPQTNGLDTRLGECLNLPRAPHEAELPQLGQQTAEATSLINAPHADDGLSRVAVPLHIAGNGRGAGLALLKPSSCLRPDIKDVFVRVPAAVLNAVFDHQYVRSIRVILVDDTVVAVAIRSLLLPEDAFDPPTLFIEMSDQQHDGPLRRDQTLFDPSRA